MTRTKALVAVVAVPLVAVLLASVAVGQARPGEAQRQGFGGGSAAVVAPAGSNVTDVAWVLDPADSSQVDSVELTFAGDLAEDSFVCAQVTNGTLPPLANGCTALKSTLLAGTPVPIPFTDPPTRLVSTTASAAAITGVSVTVTQPVAAVTTPNGVQVTDVAWTVLASDTTKVEKVDVTLDVPTGTGALKAHLTLKDVVAGDVLQRVTGLSVTGTGTTRSVTWDLTSEGDPLGPVEAKLITRFEIQVTPG